jgi:3-methyl-2-oxobutanoate hydroxymethyltransferase
MLKRTTVLDLQNKKSKNQKIVCVTAYDYTMARLIDEVDIDLVLVGDSLTSVIKGEELTIYTNIDEIIYHCACVSKGLSKSFLLADMPFMSYQVSPEQGLESAGRLLQEGRANGVKLEGGSEIVATVKKIVHAGIPVMGHVGLQPQSFYRLGGYKVQGRQEGKSVISREHIIEDSKRLEDAGVFALLLEGIPSSLAEEVTATLSIPTIGIGAGLSCSGQILVVNDLLGLNVSEKLPKLAKSYADLRTLVINSLRNYSIEVRGEIFPDKDHSYE